MQKVKIQFLLRIENFYLFCALVSQPLLYENQNAYLSSTPYASSAFCSPATFAGASTADSLAQAVGKQVEQIAK